MQKQEQKRVRNQVRPQDIHSLNRNPKCDLNRECELLEKAMRILDPMVYAELYSDFTDGWG